MKKTASVLLLIVLAFSAAMVVFAQHARPILDPTAEDDFVQFDRIEAYTQGDGVYIRWRLATETNNFGFYVLRNGDSGLEPVNQLIIPGSVTHGNVTLTESEYETFDPAGTLDSTYVIKSHLRDGRDILTSPFGVRYTDSLERATGRSLLEISTLGRENNGRLESQTPSLSSELEAIVTENLRAPDLAAHRWVVSQPAAKIGVRKDGFYRVSRSELMGAGFDVNSPSANWRLFMEGNEQAIIVGTGDEYIEFYGKAIDRPESDTRMYYLITGSEPGKRIEAKTLRSIGGNVVSRYSRITELVKERTQYYHLVKNGDPENYFGRLIDNNPPTPGNRIRLNLTAIDLTLPRCVVTIKLQGIQQSRTHLVRAVLNGQEIGTLGAFGPVPYSGELLVPTSYLVEGDNFLSLNELVTGESSFFDSFSIRVNRRYRAEQNGLTYATPGYRKVDVTNFVTPNVRVLDTTFDGTPALITGVPIVQEGATYTVKLPSSRPMTMYAFEDTQLLTSPTITANIPSSYNADSTPADVIIISYSAPDFLTAAEDWAAYRRTPTGGNFSVKVVAVDDIYDEYNYGVLSADALKAFLQDAGIRWESQYILLLGDASYDSRDYEGLGYLNYMPTKILNLIYDESSSDDTLADFDADGLPEIAIGRISARTGFEIATALNKVKEFETREGQSFDRGALFAFDIPITYDFEAMSRIIAAGLPASVPKTFVGRGMPPPNQTIPDPAAQTTLLNAINTGNHLVNYAGHGSAGTWASSGFFGSSNVPQLTNLTRQSIFTMLTCLNGYFIRPRDSDACLAERLNRSTTGGAVASWASTSETTPDYQQVMGARFYEQVAAGNFVRIGDLIIDAKTTLPNSSDLRFSWVLLGDPALKVIYTGEN